ncbi:MAG: RNA-binding S4 domain-containing protein [Clostridiales Family XIII bacterium]|jgi:ribosomal 50S subunit-recycling heat shock protein|nr:RNA-binding S4 domain-containing protein [Clostridiales Family XIII bacterium]
MRLDKFLKTSRIIKRRTVAKAACDASRVSLNGRVAKAGAEVEVGDEIEVRFGSGPLKISVRSLRESVRKEEAEELYEILPL